MKILDFFSELLGIFLTPTFLVISALVLLRRIRPKKSGIRHEHSEKSAGTSLSALSMALAGTLGVGNITGVASALISGGAGAVFWMWAGSIVSAVVKYAEVYLAVKFGREKNGERYGGAMYYIRDGLSEIRGIPYSTSSALGGFFAVLCCLNSLVTGNIVQSNAASCVVPKDYRLLCGIIIGLLVLFSLIYGRGKLEKITARLMPPLTAGYLLLTVAILFVNRSLLPTVLSDIFRSAFSSHAVAGGAVGFTFREGLRYGVMRGIFSNEAGCGTSPTAHATADTKSPARQACLGIVEVVFDTLILCTATALVLLVADTRYGIIPMKTDADAAGVTLCAFRALAGDLISNILIFAIFLFAYAAILAQIYYGTVALGYLTKKRIPLLLYCVLSAFCAVAGSIISAPVMWTLADIILGLMTVCNCTVLILLRRGID